MLYTPDTFRITLYTPEPLATPTPPPYYLLPPSEVWKLASGGPAGLIPLKYLFFGRSCGALQLLTQDKLFNLLYLNCMHDCIDRLCYSDQIKFTVYPYERRTACKTDVQNCERHLRLRNITKHHLFVCDAATTGSEGNHHQICRFFES